MDILGYELERAKEILAKAGYTNISVAYTKTPYKKSKVEFSMTYRVVRTRKTGNFSIEILACYM